ncbi:hypothetical protein M569_03764, partial [Genlisea aurea]
VVLGVDGGATSTVCICLPVFPSDHRLDAPDPPPILGRSSTGCSNHNSVGETAAREALELVIAEALHDAGRDPSAVRAVCLGVSGVNHSSDEQRITKWMRDIFPCSTKIYVRNDAVAALASGTMGKLHGCVLISGTGCIAYGFTEEGKEARAAGAGPVLGDWGSGYGIASLALTAIMKAHDGRGPSTMLTSCILETLHLSSPDEIIGWTYADSSWARIAALVPLVVSCAEAGDQVANEILINAVRELTDCVQAVVRRLNLCGEDGNNEFPVVMVGGVLEANSKWDIGEEIIKWVSQVYPRARPIRPKLEPAMGAALFAWNSVIKET